MKAFFPVLVLLACVAAGPVYAGCSNPHGNEADEIYNLAYHTWQFCNGTAWLPFGATGGGTGGMALISTQTSSSSASLQFTNLPTSYNTLFLNCSGLLMSNSSTKLLLQVGEGTGPTWETGANYTMNTWSNFGSGSLTIANDLMQSTVGDFWGSTTIPASFTIYINNVGSTSIYKSVNIYENLYVDGAGALISFWYSYWAGDTNPITGIQLATSGGDIASGTCSLYGMN